MPLADIRSLGETKKLSGNAYHDSVRRGIHVARCGSGDKLTADLTYFLHSTYPVCRSAYQWFLAIPRATLYRADNERAAGKVESGNSARQKTETRTARLSSTNDTKRNLAEVFIKVRVEAMAEAQPNLPIYSSSDDDMDHLQLQPARNRCAADDRNGEFQLWEKPCRAETTGGLAGQGVQEITRSLRRKRAKRHMDPMLITELHGQFKLDMQIDGWADEFIAAYSTFAKYYSAVLLELEIYVRRNKGVSCDCNTCRLNDANLTR